MLLRHARPRFRGSILDMGTGSGLLALEAASEPRVSHVTAVDVDPAAIQEASRRTSNAETVAEIEFVISDMFEALEMRKFDLILFNPPYLASEGEPDEPSWSGGVEGDEAILRFLGELDKHLEPDGDALMVYSSQSGLDLNLVEGKYSVEILEELPLFFERLYCVLLRLP